MAQVQQVNNLLAHFAAQTGLQINYAKSVLVPLNVREQNLQNLLQLLDVNWVSSPSLI